MANTSTIDDFSSVASAAADAAAAAAVTAASADAAADAASADAEDTAAADVAAAIVGAAAGNQDSGFDIHGDDVHIEGSVYDRYPILSSGGQMLDRIRDRFATGYFRQQSGDALKVAKVGPDSMGELSMGGYSYQILVTYLRDIPIEVSAGLDPSYHFYGNIYAIMIWACEAIPSLGSKCGNILGASFIQRPRCTRWKLKKLGPVAFTTFFDD
ncbi:hypothetical protein OROGR_012805 [Orobanche gracilis]